MDTNNKTKYDVSIVKSKPRWLSGPFLSTKYNDLQPYNYQIKPIIKNNIKITPWLVFRSKSGKMLNLLDSFKQF
jgi:hypothetical protein